MQSLIFVLLAVAGSQAEKLTSTGVDLEPIFAFLDDDGNNLVDMTELKELTVTGDADSNGEVTAAEFQAAWELIAVDFGVPAEKHAKYFKLSTVSMAARRTVSLPSPRTSHFSVNSTWMELPASLSTNSSTPSLGSSIKKSQSSG